MRMLLNRTYEFAQIQGQTCINFNYFGEHYIDVIGL